MQVQLIKAQESDSEILTEIQIRTFLDDNQRKPPGCSLEGPPGYDSEEWNRSWINRTPYYKILYKRKAIGGIILFEIDKDEYEVGRIWIDPAYQNMGLGQESMARMFELHPDIKRWVLGTPDWAVRNQHFYVKVGFRKIGETSVDPVLGWGGINYELRT